MEIDHKLFTSCVKEDVVIMHMNDKERYREEITESAHILIEENGSCRNVICLLCPANYTEQMPNQCIGGDIVKHAKDWIAKYDKPLTNIYSEDENE
jgi:hypothetical protein